MSSKVIKVMQEFAGVMKESLDKRAAKDVNRFVVKYIYKGELYGYHGSTFCQPVSDIWEAKRYEGDPEDQMKTIGKNLRSIMDRSNPEDLSTKITSSVYEAYWKDKDINDIFLDFEYLGKGVKPQTFRVSLHGIDNA